jgi:hypothetical protein
MAGDGTLAVITMVASGPTVTITIALLERPALVATTVSGYAVGVVPAVNRPEVLIEPPPTTDHDGVTETSTPVKSAPAAVNCCVPFAVSVRDFGEIVSVDSVPGPLIS